LSEKLSRLGRKQLRGLQSVDDISLSLSGCVGQRRP